MATRTPVMGRCRALVARGNVRPQWRAPGALDWRSMLGRMPARPFASSADLGDKTETLEVLGDGVYALTAEGDPNVGAVEGEDFLVCFEARATPVAARDWLGRLRQHTDKPVRYLVLSHYHAVRVLGASAFDAQTIVAHEKTRVLFAGDLVEAQAALYTGDAFHTDWSTGTLDAVKSLGAEALVGGRGAVAMGREAVEAAVEQSRDFLLVMRDRVGRVHAAGGTLKQAFEATHEALAPTYGRWPIFEHCLPFNVQRLWDELDGVDWPRIWTAERDQEVWSALQD